MLRSRNWRSAFIEKNARDQKPFFADVPITQVHFPTLPHPDFKGRTGLGDFADAVVEMDFRMGELLDGIKKAGIEDNTIFIFASDNGPELRRPWRWLCRPLALALSHGVRRRHPNAIYHPMARPYSRRPGE